MAEQTPMRLMSIDEIVIGERVRKDMGDLQSLAASMQQHGLLHPPVVKSDNTLVAGHRRIAAARLLGWKEIAVTVINVEDLLAAERDENAERKDFTPTEAVAIGRLIEEQERPVIEQCRRENISATKRGHPVQLHSVSDGRKSASEAVGLSGSTYYRAKAVVSAAEADPEKLGDLPEAMDRTGNVSGTHREMERRKAGVNGQAPRHPVHRKTHYPKPNREMERALPVLDGVCEVLEALKPEELDGARCASWSVALKQLAARINKVARRIHDAPNR